MSVDDLVRRLRTVPPYKHALEIMADDLHEWLRDNDVLEHDPFIHTIILGQGDYPAGHEIITDAVRKMNEAADALAALQARAEAAEARVRYLTERLAAEKHIAFENILIPHGPLKSDAGK